MTEEQKQKLRDLLVDGKYMTPGGDNVCIDIEPLYELIVKMMVEAQPEHSIIKKTYVVGKNPKWKVGDSLARYICTSDIEGEQPYGKVVEISYDDIWEDWEYTFDTGISYLENILIEDDAYKTLPRKKWRINEILGSKNMHINFKEDPNVYGRIVSVEFDNEKNDWTYTIKRDDGFETVIRQNTLIEQEAYIIKS